MVDFVVTASTTLTHFPSLERLWKVGIALNSWTDFPNLRAAQTGPTGLQYWRWTKDPSKESIQAKETRFYKAVRNDLVLESGDIIQDWRKEAEIFGKNDWVLHEVVFDCVGVIAQCEDVEDEGEQPRDNK